MRKATTSLDFRSSILDPHSLFISDLHLTPNHPESMAAFQHFIATVAPQAEALYILGDLFEYWAGDDDMHDAFHRQVIDAILSLSAHATRTYLMHGNRDLLMGEVLATACAATLLSDPTLVDMYGTPTLLCHGDTLCTDDIDYQAFRVQVHTIDFKKQFLSRPLAERKHYIEQLRARSDREKQEKTGEIMDVNNAAVEQLLREYHYPRLIHGHTHRPQRHEHRLEGHVCERWVLGDWDKQANALNCDAQGCRNVVL